jgi:hypothetical protein
MTAAFAESLTMTGRSYDSMKVVLWLLQAFGVMKRLTRPTAPA